ncbi:MAG TPA: DoxX family protein [Streptosporangiaceae bacterium]|nr:DoxX family protein [Streptosporangiaceae bacterium]
MRILYAAARAALAAIFVRSGWDVLNNPETPAKTAAPALAEIRELSPAELPDDETLVRINAAAQVAGGIAMAVGIAPRSAAALLIGSLIPTTYAGHAFWKHADPSQRAQQRNQFNKNLGLAGGLVLVIISGRRA